MAKNFQLQSITTKELNGVPFEKFDFTNMDHDLSGNSIVDNIIINTFVGVSGLVNGFKLKAEEENTLKVIAFFNDHLRSMIIFYNILI